MQETQVWSLGQEDPLAKGMATHSSIFVWRISWTEESGRLWSMGLQRVGHDWATNIFTFHYILSLCTAQKQAVGLNLLNSALCPDALQDIICQFCNSR